MWRSRCSCSSTPTPPACTSSRRWSQHRQSQHRQSQHRQSQHRQSAPARSSPHGCASPPLQRPTQLAQGCRLGLRGEPSPHGHRRGAALWRPPWRLPRVADVTACGPPVHLQEEGQEEDQPPSRIDRAELLHLLQDFEIIGRGDPPEVSGRAQPCPQTLPQNPADGGPPLRVPCLAYRCPPPPKAPPLGALAPLQRRLGLRR